MIYYYNQVFKHSLMMSIEAIPSTSLRFLIRLKLVHELLNHICFMCLMVREKKNVV